MYIKADMVQQCAAVLFRQADVFHSQPNFPLFKIVGRVADRRHNVLTDHQTGQLFFVGACPIDRAHHNAGAHYHDTVSDLHDFLHLMGDKHHTLSLSSKVLDELHEIIALLGRQNGRGLIHNENTGIEIQCLEDLHLLLLTHCQLADGYVYRHIKSVILCNFSDLLIIFTNADAALHIAENNVFRGCVCGHQRKVLLNHRNTFFHRIRRGFDRRFLPVDENRTGVLPVQAV